MSFADIECPVCHAGPMERCTAKDGTTVLGGAHAARVTAAHQGSAVGIEEA